MSNASLEKADHPLRMMANRIIDEVIEFHCNPLGVGKRDLVVNDIVALLSNLDSHGTTQY